jgi:DNA-binding transcriptional ArsR family regulator
VKQADHPKISEVTLAGALAALSDPVRLDIVQALRAGERSASAFDCNLANSTRSHHLKVLREAGLINHRAAGTRCFVSLRPEFEDRFPGLLASVLGCLEVPAP